MRYEVDTTGSQPGHHVLSRQGRVGLRGPLGEAETQIRVHVHQHGGIGCGGHDHLVLERDDLCRLRDEPLVMVNERYGVLAVATGPATPPSNLAMLIVCELDDEGGVVQLLSSSDDQPCWQTFALRSEPGT